MSLGLDTNVLVRYLVQDDDRQHAIASEVMHTRCTQDSPCHVSVVVVCELCWVLERCYDVDRDGIAQVIKQLLDVAQLVVADRVAVREALAHYRAGNADFPDHLIAHLNHEAGADTTVTFDKRAGKQPLFEYLGA